MLSTYDPTGAWVSPRGNPSIKRWAWLEFWEVLELHRLMLHHEECYKTPYISTFVGGLPFGYRLAIPSERRKMVLLGGDATPGMLYGANYNAKVAAVLPWTAARQLAVEVSLKNTGIAERDIPDMII